MIELQEIFTINYGNSIELNKLVKKHSGVNFVSRTAKNNGVSAIVELDERLTLLPAGLITVSLGGSVLEAFLQPKQFYTGYHIFCLSPKTPLTEAQKLYYCVCIRRNKYRYNYGRQANKTLKSLLVPAIDEIPDWVESLSIQEFGDVSKPLSNLKVALSNHMEWKEFLYEDLFDITRGKGPRKKDLDGTGRVPFITSTDSNNGRTDFTSIPAIHPKNTISVNRNGSVAETFYQSVAFCSTEDVHIFQAKFKLNKYIAMFLIALIKKEKYRYNYGRKWGIHRMKNTKIFLPVCKDGSPDLEYMESYIKSLTFSSSI